MKKRILSVLTICALIVSAASCGGNNTPAVTTAAPAQTEAAATGSADTAAAPAETKDTEAPAAETEAAPAAEEKVIPEDTPYVIENGITDRMKALADYIDGNRARLAKVFKKAQAGEPITVAYLGGSITQGSSAGPTTCYAFLTTKWLEEKFPESKITYVNAGIGATGSYIGVFRTDRDVLSQDPDLVFIDFSVNDTVEHTDRNIASYDGVIRKLYTADCAPAVITVAMTMEDGTSFQQYHSEVCRAYDIPMISYHDAILDVIDHGHIKWTDISDDNIHPNTVGHSVLTEIITSYLQKALDELDSIDTEKESDLSAVYKSDKFSSAYIVVPGDPQNISETGWEDNRDDLFGNFGGYWRALSKDGSFEGLEPLKFEVEAKSIGLFYGKMVSNGGTFDVLVDGELVKTINSDFKGGWGSYVEAEEIIDFDECGTHTVEIVVHTGEKAVVMISALALTK